MTIVDATEREAALDPLQSFCVSAPAGSGKTELLIQRFLSLLARVQRPEQILAITFTRKAAAEMRERVLQALREAGEGKACGSAHQQRTRDLALAALAVDSERRWRLLGNSARLNIRTIDGFCAALTRQMPVLSAFGAQASAVDDASPLYAEAVAELFTMVESEHPVAADLRGLMLHFDNHWDRLSELLQGLLARRDQWLTYLGVHLSPDESEQQLYRTLDALVADTLTRARRQFGPWLGELYDMQCFAAANLEQAPPEALPGDSATDLPAWRALRALLLTAEGKWRSRLDKRSGFPAGKGRPAEMKQRMTALLEELANHEGLRETLLEVELLPDLHDGGGNWQLVLQLSHVLPLLAAQLLLVFQRHGAVDHSQVAQSALRALGEDDSPTDLALRLDYRIEHILVDEFQDTAISQFELVRRLTRGWGEHNEANPQAPRTFLIVGDGMQSIYGFRDANVGLFLHARDQGFNGVLPQYLELRSNFRSEAGVVDWVNQTFAQVFPAQDDIARGEVSFSEAQAVKPAAAGPAVSVSVFHGEGAVAAEIARVCDGVAAALAGDPDSSIAILGRSRGQLQAVVEGLRTRGIAYAAQDMDRLQHSPVVMDLMTLVRALANRADRVAWMALLRAPWCGLALEDLHRLAASGAAGRFTDIAALLSDPQVVSQLSEDAGTRVAHLQAALRWAEQRRDRQSQRAWVEQVWLRLDGPATVAAEGALADAERFFQLLEQGELEGRVLDVPWLQAQLERLYADAGGAGARVQVMTLHKAKGLEFDHVFIPALARGTASDARPLLLWDEYADARGERGFLLAADDHSKTGEPGLYNYLGQQRRRKQALENTRLLYVGATRAIRRLVLSATLNLDERRGTLKPPGNNTLLACIWPAVADAVERVEAPAVEMAPSTARGRPLRRLQRPAVTFETAAESRGTRAPTPPRAAGNRLERHVGTVVHQALEWLAGAAPLPAAPGRVERERCRWALQSLGLHGDLLDEALARVMASLERTLADREAGRWLLRADHLHSACELPLTRVDAEGRCGDIVIDRTFVDADSGERWIVDYKTSQPPPGAARDSFLQEEAARYREQLLGYREALAALGSEPIRCALYFTALGHLQPLALDGVSSGRSVEDA